MGQVRVVFDTPQDFGGVMAGELTVAADRLVLMNGGDVLLDVATDNVRIMDRGAGARTERLRGSHRNHGRAWSQLEEGELGRMWGEGVSLLDLAAHFGRSRNAIGSAVRRLSLPPRNGEQSAGTRGSDAAT